MVNDREGEAKPRKSSVGVSILLIQKFFRTIETLFHSRPKSKTASAPGSATHTPVVTDNPMEMLHDRITLANAISTLEDDAQDDSYTTTTFDDNVLPVGAEEMGAGVLQSIFGLENSHCGYWL